MKKFALPTHIRAVIFDMDGVIVSSEEAHYQAERRLLNMRGHDLPKQEFKNYAGSRAHDVFAELKKRFELPENIDELVNEKRAYFMEEMENQTHAVPGVEKLIKGLHQKNILLGIGSSAEHDMIEFLVGQLGLLKYFQAIVGADDVALAKPAPDIFLKAAILLQVKPAQCLVIEDAGKGVLAGKRAGMFVIGYRNILSGTQDFSSADLIIEDFEQLEI